MAAGIVINHQLHISLWVWGITFGASGVLYVITEYTYQQSLRSTFYSLAIISYLGMALSFGGLWHTMFTYHNPPPEATVLSTYTWQDLAFNGDVTQIKETSTGKYQIDIAVKATTFPDTLQWSKHYLLRAVLDPSDLSMPQELNLGSNISFTGTVYPLEEKRNPSQFDYKSYLASKGIYTQVGVQQIHHISPNKRDLSWTFWRHQVLDAIDNNFSTKNASLAKALLIGYKNELDRSEKITFSRAGLSHIMAVSGLHVGFILAPFWLLIPYFWSFRFGKQLGVFILVATLLLYAGLTGFSASVTRASIVGVFLAYGKLFHKVRDSKNLTAVAALIILLVNPSDLFSIGFQLSFGAVYAILLTAPVIQRKLPPWIRFQWYGTPVMVVIISFIVQIGLFPLLAYYFGEFSIVGPLANAFVVPVLGLAVPYALLLLPFSMLFSTIGLLLNIPVDYFLTLLQWFVDTAASWPWSWIQVHIESVLFFGIWMTGIFLIAALPIPRMRWKVLIILVSLLCLKQAETLIQKLQPARLKITFFDVGQGDAALVITPNDRHFLIDAGRWQPDYNSAKYVLIPHLKEEGIDKLDAVFLSHPHADHIGGILELIQDIPIDIIYDSGADYDSQLYQKYQQQARRKQIPTVTLTTGDQVPLDPAMRLFVYGPPKTATAANVNNHSLILELVYGDTEFLFTGDSERSQEQRLLQHYPRLTDTDFLKVPHHGSKTSATTSLLMATTPQRGIVSLGKRNQFRHPHKEAVRRLRQHIPTLYFTSLDGAVTVFSDGSQIYSSE
jgi:competence protein ComEC